MFCYADHTPLRYQQHEISSQRCLQQGDALGPLLFCMALRKITSSINHHCSFVRNYMDDVTACGDIESLESFFAQLATASADAGLQINESKCELWGENILIPDSSALEKLPIAEWSEGIILLGSPIGSDAFALQFAEKSIDVVVQSSGKMEAFERLQGSLLYTPILPQRLQNHPLASDMFLYCLLPHSVHRAQPDHDRCLRPCWLCAGRPGLAAVNPTAQARGLEDLRSLACC